MNNDLLILDIDNFLDKYTRFMTKNIYITTNMYDTFLNQYKYLYNSIINDKYFNEKKKKRITDIYNKKNLLISLHNKKYFKTALNRHSPFLDSLNPDLSTREKMIILMDLENTYIEKYLNYENLIISKIKYLISTKSYKEGNFLILTDNMEDKNNLLNKCNNLNINVLSITDYKDNYFSNINIIDDKDKYSILINYIKNILFLDKNKFNNFYKNFKNKIYLNRDFLEYETFKDYHNYMYKRKYLKSGLSLKRFNEKEITKRRKQLRTINNELLKSGEEVDIANFLYLNSIDYSYDYVNYLFRISIFDKYYYIKYISDNKNIKKNTSLDDTIYLYSRCDSDDNYLNILVYELIKRMCSLEKISDENIYNRLKETNIDSYFTEFISKYLIPLINYYEDNNNLDGININEEEKYWLDIIYKYYISYINENKLVTKNKLIEYISNDIKNKKYKYLFLIGDISLNIDIPIFKIVDKYHNIDLIKDNIKLLYDYKKYMLDNQLIPIKDVYTCYEELSILTTNFINDNLTFLNDYINNKKDNIKLVEYDDSNRLKVYHNIGDICFNMIRNLEGNTLIGFNNMKEINIVLSSNKFVRVNENSLISNNGKKVSVSNILKIDKMYDNIILPYIIKDNFHDELFELEYKYNIKLMIYASICKCKNNLVILVPSSKLEKLDI